VVAPYVPPPRGPAELLATPPLGAIHGHHEGAERIERPSIDQLLDRAANRRICVLIGAAGWGKTTAVASWSHSHQTAWLRYEDHQGAAHRLLQQLVMVVREQTSRPAPIEEIGTLDGDRLAAAVAAVCQWTQDFLHRNLVLVFDDLHVLHPGGDGARVVEMLCRHAPDQLRLVLISRRELPFSVQRLRGRGVVSEIYAPQLAFTITDVEALLRKTVGTDPPGLARRVWEYTGGWATAVDCAVETLRVVPADQRLEAVERLSYPGERFHDYLTEEVIGAAPNWIQQLLRRLALVGEVRSMTEIAPGADAQAASAATGFAELSRQGLVRRGGEHSAWSLVPPLHHYFESGTPPSAAERAAAHVTAATDCIERGAAADALRHLLAAGDHAACAALLVSHGDDLVERGQLDAVLQAAQLPAEFLDDPRVQRVLGLARQVQGQWTQALAHFQRAGHNSHDPAPALAWRVGWIAFALGEFTEVQTLARRAQLNRQDTLDETRVLALAATAHWMSGDLAGLRKTVLQTRAAARACGDPRAWSSAHHVAALLAAVDGDWRQADAQCADAVRTAEASDGLLQLGWIKACQAIHYLEGGEPQRAQAQAQLALSLAEQCDSPFLIAHALTTRGYARARLGMLDAAARDFVTALDLYQHLGSRFLSWPLAGLGDVHRTRGRRVRARAAYEEALTLAQPHRDVSALSSALIGLARLDAVENIQRAREHAARAVELSTGPRQVPALLTRGWVELMGGDRQRAAADADRAAMAARQRRDHPGLAEAITLGVLASARPATNASSLREAIDIWQETGCRLEEATTRVVASRIGAFIPQLDAYRAEQMLRDHGVDIDSRLVTGPFSVLERRAPTLSIKTLGVFRVIRDGVVIPNTAWQSKKARDLLKILVARRRPTPRDQLMDLLWPGVDPTVAGNRLSVLLSTVCDVLQPEPVGESPLDTTDGAVSLNRAQVIIDVEEFLAQANTAFDAYRAAAPDATAQLIAAVAAHTGEFLENDPYQEWASTIAEEVRAAHIAVLRALTARLRDAGATDDAVRYTLRLLEQDRYDEEAYRTLIGVLFHAGRLGEARRHYQNYARRMAEIDVRPTPFSEMRAP